MTRSRLAQRAELHIVRLHDIQVLQAQALQALMHARSYALCAEVKVLLLQAIPADLQCGKRSPSINSSCCTKLLRKVDKC